MTHLRRLLLPLLVAFAFTGGTAQAATFVNDTFTDTSGTTLASHVGETGATWTKHTSYSSGSATISDANRARISSTSSTSYYASGAPTNADYTVDADVVVKSLAGHSGVTGRVSTAANTMYSCRYDTGTGQWDLLKVVAGTGTVLVSRAQTLTVGSTYHVQLSMVGTTISCVAGGSSVGSVTDSSVTAAGKAGVRFANLAATTNSTALHLDNFAAADAVTAATPLWNGDTFTLNTAGDKSHGGEGTLPAYQWSSAWNTTAGFQTHSNTNPSVLGATVQPDPTSYLSRDVIKVMADETKGNGTYTRMEVRGPAMFNAGDTVWHITEIYIPAGTPTLPSSSNWWTVLEAYGPPFNGSGPLSVQINRNLAGTGNDWVWRTATGAIRWRSPATNGTWTVIARKIHFATDTTGYQEIYKSERSTSTGDPTGPLAIQTLSNGLTRWDYATLDSSNNGGPNHPDLKNYHTTGMGLSTLNALYFARHRVYDGAAAVNTIDPYYTGLR